VTARPVGTFVAVMVAPAVLAGQSPAGGSLADTLARTGRRVEVYYSYARTLVAAERVEIQPLGPDLLATGPRRRLSYELRIEWEPPEPGERSGEARVVRQLLEVNGRPATPDPRDEPRCVDPAPVSPEALAIFLPSSQAQYVFSDAGTARIDGRAMLMLDYRRAEPAAEDIVWKGDCVTVDVPARTRGRAWIDIETGDVVRLDERFAGPFDFDVPWEHQRRGSSRSMTIERYDTSIRYRHVVFSDPDETLLLPSTIETLSIVKNAGSPRLRVTQTLGDYRRFRTDSRIVR
jgi:hypothetical protein